MLNSFQYSPFRNLTSPWQHCCAKCFYIPKTVSAQAQTKFQIQENKINHADQRQGTGRWNARNLICDQLQNIKGRAKFIYKQGYQESSLSAGSHPPAS